MGNKLNVWTNPARKITEKSTFEESVFWRNGTIFCVPIQQKHTPQTCFLRDFLINFWDLFYRKGKQRKRREKRFLEASVSRLRIFISQPAKSLKKHVWGERFLDKRHRFLCTDSTKTHFSNVLFKRFCLLGTYCKSRCQEIQGIICCKPVWGSVFSLLLTAFKCDFTH